MPFLTRPRLNHPHHQGFYAFVPSHMPKPGTQNLVFEPALMNPVFSIASRGTFAGSMNILPEHPQIAMARTSLVGIGGMQFGTFALTPLSDTGE